VRPIEQGEGDSLVAAFPGASDAAAAALDIQRALLEEDWPEGADIAVRMALHTGEAQLRDGLYYVGPSIIRCARLRALAHGGQILISAVAADLLADGLPDGVALLPLGVHRLKDLRQPERVFQFVHPSLPSKFPPLRSIESLPNNLPIQLTSFVGREAALEEVTGLLADRRLVTLVGPGGSGKTRLAAQIAGGLAREYPDGMWWVDLAAVGDPERVPATVMGALGLLDSRSLDAMARITSYVADQRLLLVLDNCEHVVAAVSAVASAVLEACPNATFLATSREPLGTAGERAWPVPPLSLPSDDSTLESMLGSEAVRLFIDRAVEVRPAFRVDAGSVSVVAAICARLDGIPLAVELAAARLRSLSPDRVLAGLADRFRILTGGARSAPARQQTLEASVQWSHNLLAEAEQVLFRRLAVFAGSFGMEAAEVVAGTAPLEEWEVLTLLGDLVDKSLVVFDGDRYRLLQSIADFAGRRLVASGEAPAVGERHASFFLGWARAANAELEVAPQPELLEALETDHDNLRAALRFALDAADHEQALQLLNALSLFWGIRGQYSEALRWHRTVLAAVPGGNSALRLRALGDLSHLSLYGMEIAGAFGTAEAEQAAAAARECGDDALLVRPLLDQLLLLGWIDPDTALPALEALVDQVRRVGDPWALRCSLWWLGFHWTVHRDRPDRAVAAFDELGRLVAETPNPYWRAGLALGPGVTAVRQGRYPEAREILEEALSDAYAVIDPFLESYSVGFLCDVPLATGDLEGAASLLARSIERQDRIGSSLRLESLEVRLAGVDVARGDLAAAREQLDRSLSAVQTGVPFLVLFYNLARSRIAREEGDLKAAREPLDVAVQAATALGTPWYLVMVHHAAGGLARTEGNPGEAEDHHHRALALCAEYGFRGVAAEGLEALAGLSGAAGSHAEAARLFGAAETLREETGHRRWPIDEALFQADVAASRADLGPDGFEALRQEGASLGLAGAVAYASRARGERKRPSKGWEALTPTELEVARLAADGLTNAEIGGRLFISPGTAKTHLAHIYAKLGIANRAQLAAIVTARSFTGNRR
jgi:predicted ATPase/DNA-binding CsgD family transcriptional regulator